MPKNYGFARCSLTEEKGQDLNRQVRELKAAGAEEIITERVHGDAKVKPQLDFLLEHIEENSSLYVTEVSRLSRSTQQLCEILNMIKEKHLRLVILNSVTIDCRNGDIDPRVYFWRTDVHRRSSWQGGLEGRLRKTRS